MFKNKTNSRSPQDEVLAQKNLTAKEPKNDKQYDTSCCHPINIILVVIGGAGFSSLFVCGMTILCSSKQPEDVHFNEIADQVARNLGFSNRTIKVNNVLCHHATFFLNPYENLYYSIVGDTPGKLESWSQGKDGVYRKHYFAYKTRHDAMYSEVTDDISNYIIHPKDQMSASQKTLIKNFNTAFNEKAQAARNSIGSPALPNLSHWITASLISGSVIVGAAILFFAFFLYRRGTAHPQIIDELEAGKVNSPEMQV